MAKKIEFGIVGLGRMGADLALQALSQGMRVVGTDLKGAPDSLKKAGFVELKDLRGFKSALASPRIIFLYIPSGKPVDDILDQCMKVLDRGDILVDGGNSYWGDSVRRHEYVAKKGFHYIDLGTSGGVRGARNGACFMAGGEKEIVKRVEPILQQLAVKDGYVHAGPGGAGHFTKLVHNGIEFGMLQAIGEGMQLLTQYSRQIGNLDITNVLRCWRHGSVIRSWLVDLLEEGYRANKGIGKIPNYIDDTGEVNWLVTDALQLEVPIPAISTAVMQLLASRDGDKDWAKAIEIMRHGFGGHAFGKDPAAQKERYHGRVGDFYRPETPKQNPKERKAG